MELVKKERHISVVILNYNSENDLMLLVPQLAAQIEIKLSLILVDNASRPQSVERIKSWLLGWRPDTVVGTKDELDAWVKSKDKDVQAFGRVYFITHHENRGYSVGNNIGIRLADSLGADAILIANPDMRIENPNYLAELSKHLFSNDLNYVAASRIIGLDGKDQNPLRESSFWEEVLWPLSILGSRHKLMPYVLPITGDQSVRVPKVSGCCLLLRMSHLKTVDYLDEGVFLYCEEPILAARVHGAEGNIVFVPSLMAIHAHHSLAKGNPSKRMLQFIKSRRYYLKWYSDYNEVRLIVLAASYQILYWMHRIRAAFTRSR